MALVSEIERIIAAVYIVTNYHGQQSFFLRQRFLVAVQRGNVARVHGTIKANCMQLNNTVSWTVF